MRTGRLLAAAAACLLVGSLLAAPVAAVDSDATEIPEESAEGEQIEATIEVTNLYDEFESWTLRGDTNLTGVTWTVVQFDQSDTQIDQTQVDGTTVETAVDIEDGTDRIEVRVTGTTPKIENYTYEPPQRFTAVDLTQVRSGGTQRDIDSYEIHHFTEKSKQAREAIDGASEAVENSGSEQAQSSLQAAISAHENENFENAITLAERAEDEASQRDLLTTVLLFGGAAVGVLLVAGVGFRVYQSRQQDPARLR
jgi:hypothetical protein